MGTDENAGGGGGNPAYRLANDPGGSRNTRRRFMLRKPEITPA